ncbi:ankyrin, partial [Terfezia boudieri ATCC MYA-4762]
TLCLNAEQKVQLKPKLSCRIHVAAEDGYETALQLLLDMGADINEENSHGGTALLRAVYHNHLSCVKILIGRGADATISTHEGFSALDMAVRGLTDKTAKILVQAGASLTIRDKRQRTPCEHAWNLGENELAEYL